MSKKKTFSLHETFKRNLGTIIIKGFKSWSQCFTLLFSITLENQ